MMWKEVKKWATSHGYKVDREKIDGTTKKYDYFWEEKSNPNKKGQADSVFNLAKAIYNSITNDAHVKYQQSYQQSEGLDENYMHNAMPY